MTGLRLLPEAEAELRAAAKRIDDERPGLGLALIREVRAAFERIRFLPQASPVERGEMRVLSTDRFPYRIHYLVRGDEILIVAIAHRRRRPDYWRYRVEEIRATYRSMPDAA